MLIGYVRNWPSGPKRQEPVLREAGCEIIYTDSTRVAADTLGQRAFAIKALRAGRTLVVTEAAVFGRTAAEIVAGLREIHDAAGGEADLLILATGKRFAWAPGVDRVVELIDEAINRKRFLQTAAGRETARGKGGRPRKLNDKQLAAARRDWHSQLGSQDEIAKRHGLSVPRMHALFGSWAKGEITTDRPTDGRPAFRPKKNRLT